MKKPLLLPMLLLAACSPWKYTVTNEPSGPGLSGQTYAQAVKVMCEVDQLAQLPPDEPLELADTKRFAFLDANVDNPDGIFLRTLISVKSGEDRACLLRDAQKEVGLSSCALADTAAPTQN